jgi:ubiquinone/menaquinone biosynthesis C-methylase UbiE
MEKVKSLSALHSYSGTVPQLGVVDRAKAVAKSTAKRGIDVYFALKCGLLRTFGVIDFPVPPNHCLRRTSSLTLRHYYESGVTTMMPIITAARIFGVDLDQPVSVLDFGCGVARQFLQLNRNYPRVKAHACDAHPDNVRYVKSTFTNADVYANNFDPPLKYADNTFDLVYSVSTFSHFSMEDAKHWLGELSRVTKPGGVLCLTFNSYTSIDWTHQRGGILDYTPERLTQDGHWYHVDEAAWYRRKAEEAVSAFGSNTTGATRPTGDMFFSPEYAKIFVENAGLELLAIAPGVIDRMQDLEVIRKPKR